MQAILRCVAFLLGCALLAAQTYVVDAANGPGTDFTSLAVATATVPDGAVLEVRPGNYGSFAIVGKSLTIRGGLGAGSPGVVIWATPIVAVAVVGIASHQSIELDGLELRGALSLTNCDGLLLIHRTGYSTEAQLRATDCRRLMFRSCRFGDYGNASPTASLERCRATFEASALLSARNVLTLTSSTVQFVDSGVAVGGFNSSSALSMSQSDIRANRSGFSSVFGSAIVGSGTARLDPSCNLVGWGGIPWSGPVQVTRPELPAVTATGGALGGTLVVGMTGPDGDPGALAVGLPGIGLPSPGALDPQWILPGTMTVSFLTVFASGVPQQATYAMPNVPAFRGVRLAWQGVSVGGGAALQVSNPAITSHW